jgi:hypothetical protein
MALQSNLLSLIVFLQQYPVRQPFFTLPKSLTGCQQVTMSEGRSDASLELSPDTGWREVVAGLNLANGESIVVPLYIVAPTERRLVVPLYGIPAEVRPTSSAFSERLAPLRILLRR